MIRAKLITNDQTLKGKYHIHNTHWRCTRELYKLFKNFIILALLLDSHCRIVVTFLSYLAIRVFFVLFSSRTPLQRFLIALILKNLRYHKIKPFFINLNINLYILSQWKDLFATILQLSKFTTHKLFKL